MTAQVKNTSMTAALLRRKGLACVLYCVLQLTLSIQKKMEENSTY